MRLSDYKKDYYWYSGKASDVARSVAFAGVAIIWIFRIAGEKGPQPPETLLLPLALLAAGLVLDLLQYIWGAATWGFFHRYHEAKLEDPKLDPPLDHSEKLAWPMHALFVLKLVAVLAGYWGIGAHLWSAWYRSG